MIGDQERHLAAVSGIFRNSGGGRCCCRPVDKASDSCRSNLLLKDPTYLCILQTKTRKKLIKVFNIIFYHIFFLPVFTPHFSKKKTFEIFKQNLQVLTDCWRPCHQNNIESWKKLTVKTWSQKIGSLPGLGLRIRQKILTNCCFCYFLAKFFQSTLRPNTATFQQSDTKFQ